VVLYNYTYEITCSRLQQFSGLLNSLRLTASKPRLNVSQTALLGNTMNLEESIISCILDLSLTFASSLLTHLLFRLSLSLSLSLILRPTASRPVCLGIKHPSRAYEQIFITVRQLACLLMWDALSDERTGLSFTIAAGPCQRSHFRVRVP
jgi:hypothetical protein